MRSSIANLTRTQRAHRSCLTTTFPTRNSSTSSKSGPNGLKYPGLGLELRFKYPESGSHLDPTAIYPIIAHHNSECIVSRMLPVRELAMMSIMDRLTDKPDWNRKVFDEGIVEKWRREALAIPDDEFWKLATVGKEATAAWGEQDDDNVSHIMEPKGTVDSEVFDYCVQELRVKARYFEETGLIPTLDADSTVVKSDVLIKPDLHSALEVAFAKLKNEQAARPDWHPNSDSKVLDIVHPSLYPLVYGRTRVLQEEVVGVGDAIETWAGKGDVIAKQKQKEKDSALNDISLGVGDRDIHPDLWSETYQWLPTNMEFQADGTVRFTSYINNLHPTKHAEIYRAIEQLVDAALPAWEQCLTPFVNKGGDYTFQGKEGPGRTKGRFAYAEEPDDMNLDNWIFSDAEAEKRIRAYMNEEERCGDEWLYDNYDNSEVANLVKLGFDISRRPRPPAVPGFSKIDYAPADRLRLAQRFANSGLQVIVKMASIELSPEKPNFPIGNWHMEGQMNEQICATALYYLDNENITENGLSFRMQTDAYVSDDINVNQNSYSWLESTYGVSLGSGSGSLTFQNYGPVATKPGRLLAFPNVFQHRVSPFELADKSKPGHRTFIALWLVDPHRRIISTANVPPQQLSWMAEKALGAEGEDGAGLMAESQDGAVDAVREYFGLADDVQPMTWEEAQEHRVRLMEERTAHLVLSDGQWCNSRYSFCEH